MKKEEKAKPKRHKNGKWVKGCSGNKNGRPKGALGMRTLALKAMMDCSAEDVIRVLQDAAIKDKDIKAAQIILSRILPIVKENPVSCPDLPEIHSLADIPKFQSAVIDSVKNSDITVSQAEGLARLAGQQLKVMQYLNLEREIELIKEKLDKESV